MATVTALPRAAPSRAEPHAGAGGTAAGGTRFPCLDGYRGLAAMIVLIYHVMGKLNIHIDHPLLGQYTGRLGNYGVTVFFLLSGFLLYRPFVLAHFRDEPPPKWSTFYVRRLARIIPAYWVALTFLLVVFRYADVSGIGDVVTFYGFAQIYRPGAYPIGGLGQAWSLCVEMTYYLFLPMLAFALNGLRGTRTTIQSKMRGQLVGLGVLLAISTGYKMWAVPRKAEFPVAHLWLPARMDLFVLGMLLAVISAWVATGNRLPWIVERFTQSPWLCMLFAIELYWIFSQLHLPIAFEREEVSQTMLRYPFSGLSAFFFLIPGTLGNSDKGPVAGFLRSWPIASLGVVSYGIYLWHTIWLEFMLNIDAGLTHNIWFMLFIVSALTIASATVSYVVVERPVLNLVHRRRGS